MNTYTDRYVMVEMDRYDELLRKETVLTAIEGIHKRTSGYSFHEVVGFLLKNEVKADG